MASPAQDIVRVAELIKNDWKDLPNILKYCYIGGIFSLIATWIYNSDSIHRSLSFWLSLFLIVGVPLIYWVAVRIKIMWYRFRYPIEEVSKNILFATTKTASQAIHLIHLKRKQIRWIENGRTALDLRFYPSAWTSKLELDDFKATIEHNGTKYKLDEFKLKAGIRTQDKPGS